MTAGNGARGGGAGAGQVSRPRRLQINPEALKVVDASRRKFWEEMAHEVEVEYAKNFRRRWTAAETARVILATPDETYEEVARELDRSPGAVRYRRMAMIHLLKEEHAAPERVAAYIDDPKVHHKHHDYFQIHDTLQKLGYYDKPVSEQFALARPLRQPSKSWRGDGSAAALAGTTDTTLRDEVRRLLQAAQEAARDLRA